MADFSDDDFNRLVDDSIKTSADIDAEREIGDLVSWNASTLGDAYKQIEPTEFVIDGLLPLPSLSIMYGGPGSLKSMVLLDMGLCVAAGVPWLEPLPDTGGYGPGANFKTNQAPVMWLDFDNGPRRTSERVGAIGRGHNLDGSTPFRYVSMPNPWLDASDFSQMLQVIAWVKRHGSRLILVDNLSLVSGSVDENSGQMSQVLSRFRVLAEETQSAVIIIHHQRKSNGLAAGVTSKSETLRGHSSINAMLDLALLVERNGREDAVLITPTKVRDYQDFETFGALWTFEHFPDTKQLYTGRFWAKSTANPEQLVNMAVMQHIKNELRGNGWMSAKDVLQLVRDRMAAQPGGKPAGTNKIYGLMREMAEAGQLMRRGNQKSLEYLLV
jgi:hypothetical protein